MRAAVCTRYGPPEVIEIRDVVMPTPGPRQILVRVDASCVNSGDSRLRSLRVPTGMALPARVAFGWQRPKFGVPGTDFAGTVAAVGASVSRFIVGDHVYGSLGMRTGTHAEYVVVDEDGTVGAKPEKLSMIESVSLVFGGLTAQSFLLGRASLRAGERVLINGATGSVGSASIQLARHVGAHVTAVCRAQNEGLALSLGAHEVIDYYRHDFAGIGESWDVIMDNVGNVCWRKASHILRPGGRLVLAVADLQTMVGGFLRPHRSGRRVIVGVAEDRRAMLDQLSAMVASNSLAPTVGCVLPFAEVVRAHAYVDTGHKVGSVVLDLSGFA